MRIYGVDTDSYFSSTVAMSQKNSVKKTKFCNGYVMFSVGQNIIYCTKQLPCAVVGNKICMWKTTAYNINYKFNASYG